MLSTNYFCDDSTISNTLAAMVGSNNVELENWPLPDTNMLTFYAVL